MALEFTSWRRAELVHGAQPQGGRLRRALAVTLSDSAVGPAAPGDVAVVFRSAADIGALTQAAIRHRAPAPGSADAETTKCTHVDFASPDLPWRYTPRGAEPGHPDRLRPWLALIVGDAGEVRIDGAVASITRGLLAKPYHRLGDSWRWAHVHAPVGDPTSQRGLPAPNRLSRLLSMRNDLRPLTSYTAVLVPTFTANGEDMWDAQGVVRNGGTPLPVLASWTFTTGEGGDFETLSTRLRMPPAGDIGKASLTYSVGSPADPDAVIGPVEVRGALASLQDVREPPPEGQDALAAQMATWVRESAADPEVLGLPDYGVPWVAAPQTHAAGWMRQLREDARVRIHAGTGVWTGIEAQDELMRAAVQQAGALQAAAGKIARTAGAVIAAGAQWERALPTDAAERLAVLAPLAARLPVEGSDATVADAVTGPDRTLDRGLITGAGTRLLGRATRSHRARGPGMGAMLDAANTPPDTEGKVLDRLRRLWELTLQPDGGSRFELLLEVVIALSEGRTDDAAHVLTAQEFGCRDLRERIASTVGVSQWDDVGTVLDGSPDAVALVYGPVQTVILQCILGCIDVPESEAGGCHALVAMLRIPAPRRPRPVKIDGLSEAVAGAVDPRRPDAPIRRRLAVEVQGLPVDSLTPPRFPLGLDFPTWSLLRAYEPDWLLPGAQTVPRHTITALQTNPEFIDAFLVGLNTQFLAEVRWRGLQVDRWGTPLRMFFAPVDPRTGTRIPDVIPIGDWTDTSELGDRSHQEIPPAVGAASSSERLVILFHTPLFRRYPSTLVYLHRSAGDDEELDELALSGDPTDLTPPAGASQAQLAAWYLNRWQIAPAFSGSISPELVFFVFDIAPDDLSGYYLVLDEPAMELRFRNDLPSAGATSSAAVAGALIDRHTRVAISGRHLEEQGNAPG